MPQSSQARRDTDRLLLSSSDPLSKILDLAEDAIISVSQEPRIILFNQVAEKIFGYSANEIRVQSLEVLLPSLFAHAHREHIHDFAVSGHTARRMGDRREIYARRRNGEEFPAEASISKVLVE